MAYIQFVLVGAIAGVFSGMFGIGGGVVIVPILTVIVGFGLREATGTSLAALLLPVGIFAVLAYYRAGYFRWRVVVPVAFGLLIGAIGGANVALTLPVTILQQLYGIFLLWMSWRFVEPRKLLKQAREGSASPADPLAERHVSPLVLVGVGLLAGVFSGMFGIGGGNVIVPVLVSLLKFDQKVAVGTSLGALLLPVSIGAVVTYYQAGMLDVAVAATMALGLLIGAALGAKIALGLSSVTIKRYYGVLLLFVGLRFLFRF